MNNNILPPQTELLNAFDYNPDTGELRWKKRMSFRIKIGDIAGCKDSRGYISVRINKKLYRAHRVIWKMVHGYDPEEIDHINHDPSDNRISNLRSVSRGENMKNVSIRHNNESGCTGVWFYPPSKWKAQISIDNKIINLGLFKDKNDAIDARKAAEIKYGFHKNHGF